MGCGERGAPAGPGVGASAPGPESGAAPARPEGGAGEAALRGATVLVAGGAGYIGSHVAEELLRRGASVLIVDNLSTGHAWAVEELRARYERPGGPAVAFARLDVRETEALAREMRAHRVSAVVHLCADSLVGESMRRPLRYFDNNVGGAISLLKAMEAAGVRALVFSSSAAVYGEQERVPIPEEAEPRPVNPYGLTKLQMEQIISWQAAATPLRAVALRYFNVAGASGTARLGEAHAPETHLVPNVLRAAGGSAPLRVFGTDYPTRDGTCVRDYVDVRDLARAHVLALGRVLGEGGVSGGASAGAGGEGVVGAAAGTPAGASACAGPGAGSSAGPARDPAAPTAPAAPEPRGSFEVFNLGSERGYTVLEVIREAERSTGASIPFQAAGRRPGDPPALVASSSRIRALGWLPRHGLPDMVSSAWAWHRGAQGDISGNK